MNVSVAGLYRSALPTGLKPLWPPATSTLPSSRSVADGPSRPVDMLPEVGWKEPLAVTYRSAELNTGPPVQPPATSTWPLLSFTAPQP